MNIYNLKQIFDNIAIRNDVNIEYKLLPLYFYGYYDTKENIIVINKTLSNSIQIETEIHEFVHFFDVYHKDPLCRETIADYITIQLYNLYNLDLTSYTDTQIRSITESFKTVINDTIYNNIYSMIFYEIEFALKNLKNNF